MNDGLCKYKQNREIDKLYLPVKTTKKVVWIPLKNTFCLVTWLFGYLGL